MTAALLLSLLAGAAIPAGGLLAAREHIRPLWLEEELRHGVLAFGAGALLAAIAFALVPHGLPHLDVPEAGLAFAAGGVVFMGLDRFITDRFGPSANLVAMLLDFVPEAIAMGASFAAGSPAGLLLALLITMQNLPEAFNAYREMCGRGTLPPRRILALFGALALLGPLAAFLGMAFFAERAALTALLMLFAAGGILYLVFQDIAPQVKLERHWVPSLGATLGFLVGLVGNMLIG